MPDDINKLPETLRAQADLVQQVLDAHDMVAVIEQLATTGELVRAALDEAMGQAVLSGASMRQVAIASGVAPNSVPPALARSSALSGYATAGRVTATEVGAARYDAREQQPEPQAPMKFSRRKP